MASEIDNEHREIRKKYCISVARINKATTPEQLLSLHSLSIEDLKNMSGEDLENAQLFAIRESRERNVKGKV